MTAGKSVAKKAALVGALTGVSRVLGLVREMLTSRLFGTGVIQSAFVVAFTIPNLFRRLFGEGALSSAFIPAFTSVKEKSSRDDALKFAGRMITLLGAGLSVVVLVGIAGTLLVAPYLDPSGKWAHILPFLRIMLPYAVFICMAALAMGMLNVLDDFGTPAIAPAILNIVWIFVLVAICPLLPNDTELRITAVAAGIVIAGILQFAYMWNGLRKRGWRITPMRGFLSDERVKNVLITAFPAAVGAGVIQINVCMDHMLAFWAAEWAPASLQYAERVLYLPMGLVATAFSTVLLPTFSRQYTAGDIDGLKSTLRSSINDLMTLMMPAAAGLIAIASPVVSLLFEGREFTAADTMLTSRALICYAPGLIFFTMQKILNPVFFAMHDTATPTKVSCSTVVLNLILNISFILLLPLQWKHAGIALSTVLSSIAGSAVLVIIAGRRIGSLGISKCMPATLKALPASAIMSVAAYFTCSATVNFLTSSGADRTIAKATSVAAAMAIAIILYFGILAILSPADAKRIAAKFAGRLRR